MWETFLLQMNDFERFLEAQLRHMLGPVVASPAPSRGFRSGARQSVLTLELPAPDPSQLVEPVVVAVPAAAQQL